MRAMTSQNLRAILRQRPFEPFRILTTSGQAYEVRHPEAAMVVRNGVIVSTPTTDGRRRWPKISP